MAAVAGFISGFGAGTAAEQHTQEEAARQQSTEMVTLQIYNERRKHGTPIREHLTANVDFTATGNTRSWGKKLVLTGARLIGQVPEGE